MGSISIKQLLEAGVHFGHQTHRWNPKMKSYIFGEQNGIHIIDLQKTIRRFKVAVDFVTEKASRGSTVLFVGTKSQAQEVVEEQAKRCGMYFINNRWLGGLLTNFVTVQNSIKRYRELDSMRETGFYDRLSKKEAARLERERKRLEKNLRGIKDMERCPDILFIVDSGQETIAVKEATKLGIPIVAVVDSNSDPDCIDYVIPGNDDALRAIQLFAGTVAEAVLAGRMRYEAHLESEKKKAQEKAAREASKVAKLKQEREAQAKLEEISPELQSEGKGETKAEEVVEVETREKAALEPKEEAELTESQTKLVDPDLVKVKKTKAAVKKTKTVVKKTKAAVKAAVKKTKKKTVAKTGATTPAKKKASKISGVPEIDAQIISEQSVSAKVPAQAKKTKKKVDSDS